MDLFEQNQQRLTEVEAPLAARMRPRSLDDFIGQTAIIGPGKLLRRAIQADQLSSLIFYGPPGTGKTTLARVIANTTMAQFVAINAVLGGVKDIRAAIDLAQTHRGQQGRRTILFVDEVHRFNKAQQDALLPWVENGTVILIGATTENPFFEVNKALVSRSRVFQLKPLEGSDLRLIVQQALRDENRGYGDRSVQLDEDAIAHLVNVANGDARTVLNALELAVETTPADQNDDIHITLAVAEDSIQQRAVLYDKEGDAHFDTISAFIKSVRGSDPDAALYWLAKRVYAGEDPRYIFRRLVILAGEDVGMADPNAVVVVTGCAAAFDRVGMPEGRYPLAQATLYLATAPKSNSVMAFFDALAAVQQEKESDVPNAMRDATRDKKGFGHGAGYLYPHAYRDHWVAQQYLPTSLQGQIFYQPSDQGYEGDIQTQVARKREAQLAGLVESNLEQSLPEALTYGPDNLQQDRWLQRATGVLGTQLG
ncbi:MAG: AAA family ATPase, partial [Phormidesmis sp.]